MSNLPHETRPPEDVAGGPLPDTTVEPTVGDLPVPSLDLERTTDPSPPTDAEAAVDPGSSSTEADQGADGAAEERSTRGAPVDAALGVIRLGVGAALVVAPAWAGRIWVGPGADGPGSRVFARALGARDVALGLRILQGWRQGEPVRHWVAAGFAADAADVVATLIASRDLTPTRRAAVPLVAGAVGAAGVWSDRRADPT